MHIVILAILPIQILFFTQAVEVKNSLTRVALLPTNSSYYIGSSTNC